MEPLNEQLSKLKLLNSPLSPRIHASEVVTSNAAGDTSVIESSDGGKVAALAQNFQQGPHINIPKDLPGNGQCKVQQLSPSGLSPNRKVGPIVPPKPSKSIKVPEVPQSMLIRQTCEPLYSKRLQSNRSRDAASCTDGLVNERRDKFDSSRPPLLHRKQPSYDAQHNIYGKMNKVTLDNPAILEQQLEALAHHKMQLEKKGLLQQQNTVVGNISCVPKLSTSSLFNDVKKSGSNTNLMSTSNTAAKPTNVYSNVSQSYPNKNVSTEMDNAYSNIILYERGQKPFGNGGEDDFGNTGGSFRNALYENNTVLNLPILSQDALSIANLKSADYLKNQNDDDIPLPPSPVSSSYSELRRATDIFAKGPENAALQQFHDVRLANNGNRNSNMQYPQFDENITSNKVLSAANSPGLQQTYMNVNFPNDFATYSDSPSMQGSSTYESIYEPINPRPPSQLSSRSNYLMYVQYVNTPLSANCIVGNNTNSSSTIPASNAQHSSLPSMVLPNNLHNPKELEVEALTDFLVHSMDSSNDVDIYGVCVKCNERVVGENSGCTAMKQIYHISCFTCSQCQINLQGKPFYALEGKPYCEYDYLQTLEKCSVCMKPILERILRATGKPYHPQCFTCVVCGNSLDGIPFTVDAINQNYCISDFHKKFAPRCCVCKQPIMPEPGQEETVRVVALDRSFHFECYKCEDCGLLLSSEAEGRGCYPLDDHVLCKSCNAQRVQMLTNRMTTEL